MNAPSMTPASGYLGHLLELRRRLLARDLSPFLLELPPYHVPTLRGLLTHTWFRLQGFVLRAGKAFVAVVLLLNFVNSIGTDGSFGNQNTERSLLSAIGKSITPVFAPMGLHWATNGLGYAFSWSLIRLRNRRREQHRRAVRERQAATRDREAEGE